MTNGNREAAEGAEWTWPAWLIVPAALWPALVLAAYLRLAALPVLLRFEN